MYCQLREHCDKTLHRRRMMIWPDRRLLDLLGIELPIIQAPMAGRSGSAMAIPVTRRVAAEADTIFRALRGHSVRKAASGARL